MSSDVFGVYINCMCCGEEGIAELPLPLPLKGMQQSFMKAFRDKGWLICKSGAGYNAICPKCRPPEKNSGPMDATYRVLERRYAIYLLNLIYEYPGRSKMFYKCYDSGFKSTKNQRLLELEEAGFIRSDNSPRNHGSVLLFCTESGEKLAETFKAIRKSLPETVCLPEEY